MDTSEAAHYPLGILLSDITFFSHGCALWHLHSAVHVSLNSKCCANFSRADVPGEDVLHGHGMRPTPWQATVCVQNEEFVKSAFHVARARAVKSGLCI